MIKQSSIQWYYYYYFQSVITEGEYEGDIFVVGGNIDKKANTNIYWFKTDNLSTPLIFTVFNIEISLELEEEEKGLAHLQLMIVFIYGEVILMIII